jgi:hypothetical protein
VNIFKCSLVLILLTLMSPAQSTGTLYPGYTTSMNGHIYVWTTEGWRYVPEGMVMLPSYKGPDPNHTVNVPSDKVPLSIRITKDEYLRIRKSNSDVLASQHDSTKLDVAVKRSEVIEGNIAKAYGVKFDGSMQYWFNGPYLMVVHVDPNRKNYVIEGSCGPKC